MKILQVVHDFLPKAIGGTQIYTYSLSKELSKQHEIYLFFRDIEVDKDKFIKKGYFDGLPFLAVNPNKYFKNFPYFNLIRHGSYFFSNNKKIDGIFKDLIDEFKPDVVHFQHLIGFSPNLIKIVHEKKIPIVFTVHDYWLLCPKAHLIDNNLNICNITRDKFKCIKCLWNDELYRFKKNKISQPITYIEIPKNLIKIILNYLKRLYMIFYIFYIRPRAICEIIRKSDLFISPSYKLKNKLIEYGIPKNKIIYLDLGIDDIIFDNVKKTPSKKIRFAFIGSAMSYKGINVLIESFTNIKDAFLYIYGIVSEEDKKKYMKLIKNNNINFMGGFKHGEISEIFSKIDILIVPSICMENSPLTIKEAFAYRTPVIASNIGGLSEMVQDGKTGLLFKMGNSRDLFEKIRYFIDNPYEVGRMSKEIRRVKTIKEHVVEMNNVYKNLIEKI
jgi:glycosyltransferase involved in cell wall biosynthesis